MDVLISSSGMGPFGLGAATSGEPFVFGAQRPGYGGTSVTEEEVDEWFRFMRQEGIKRIVCLLPDDQLRYYTNVPEGLLHAYEAAFGAEWVSHHPILDFHLCEEDKLRAILAVLHEANAAGEKVVVHCSGGIGRTGHVLAAWLVNARGYSAPEAITATRAMGRNAREAVEAGRASEADLMGLLSAVRP
jgi:protein-tyrosine phosphatase